MLDTAKSITTSKVFARSSKNLTKLNKRLIIFIGDKNE